MKPQILVNCAIN